MGSLADILKQRRKELGLTLAQIAEQMGVAEATVQRWESGNIKSLRHDKISRLADVLDVSPASLMGWEIDTPQLPPGCLPAPRFVKKPRLGTIACGKPVLAVEDADMFDFVPEDVECDFTLRCNGDSMVGARIHDGDIVLIKKQDIVEDGEIAAVLIGDETTLKRVYYDRENNVLQLFAENPMYKTMRFTGPELDNIRILGKAVAFLSTVR